MKLINFIKVLRDQGPFKRFLRNTLNGNIRGVFHIRSHTRHGGKDKVMYNTKETARKAADSMAKKIGARFDVYKCLYCDGYHIGKHHTQNANI